LLHHDFSFPHQHALQHVSNRVADQKKGLTRYRKSRKKFMQLHRKNIQ